MPLPRSAHAPARRLFPSPKNVVSAPETSGTAQDGKLSMQTLHGDDDPDVKEAAEAGLKFISPTTAPLYLMWVAL